MRKVLLPAAAALLLLAGASHAASTYTVEPVAAADDKAVFATVESLEIVPARVRTGGTIASLSVKRATGSSAARSWLRSAIRS